MTDEEKEAIGLLEDIKNGSWSTKYIMSKDSKNAEILLNLIQKQQEEIKKKDKQINEMAGYLAIIRDCPNEDKGANLDCENRCSTDDDIYADCWKLYFERKVEDDNKK